MNPETPTISGWKIFRFWLPLQATWLMMAAEGPFLAAVIARLPLPKFNLAAYGVASSLAMIIEAPIIMMLSASNALVFDRLAFLKLRRFTYALNAAITTAMLLVIFPPFFSLLSLRWIGLTAEISRLTWKAALLLVPWPAAIGYRRFYQGILIRNGNTRAVAYGTVVRLSSMAATGLFLSQVPQLSGAAVGAAALSAGVVMEAAASRFMASRLVRGLLAQPDDACGQGRELTYTAIWRFYMPLALTSFLALAVYPLITFFLGRSRCSVESLAVLPVINSLAFIFRAPGIAFQEAVIALLGEKGNHFRELRLFAWRIAFTTTAFMAALTWTPLSGFWFRTLSGLAPDLARFAVWPGRIASLLPLLETMISLQRGLLVKARRTGPIIAATAVHVATLSGFLTLLVFGLRWRGAVAAVSAHSAGYVLASLYLLFACLRQLKENAVENMKRIPC